MDEVRVNKAMGCANRALRELRSQVAELEYDLSRVDVSEDIRWGNVEIDLGTIQEIARGAQTTLRVLDGR